MAHDDDEGGGGGGECCSVPMLETAKHPKSKQTNKINNPSIRQCSTSSSAATHRLVDFATDH